MPTTFQTRELVRDELVTIFQTNGSWTVDGNHQVYGYFPSANEIAGKTPLLIILSGGTQQDMASEFTNPTLYRFQCLSFVLADSDSDNWTPANAEDRLDELDRAFRQVIRDRMVSLSTADTLRFDEGFSERVDVNLGGLPYIRETRNIIAKLASGSKP